MNNDWIMCATISDIDNIKNKIDSIIESNNIQSSVEGKSTRGYQSHQFDLFDYQDQFQDVINTVQNKVQSQLKCENLALLSSWSVYGNHGGYHTIHRHNDVSCDDVSTVLYLSISEYDTHNPGSFFAIINNNVVTHQPSVGDLLIFPVGILHGTYPQGKGLRQTLSNDFKRYRDESQ